MADFVTYNKDASFKKYFPSFDNPDISHSNYANPIETGNRFHKIPGRERLEQADLNELTEINPSGLVVGKTYLLYDNYNYARVTAKYIGVSNDRFFFDNNNKINDKITQYFYKFKDIKDKIGEIVIEGFIDYDDYYDYDEDIYNTPSPYDPEMRFDPVKEVFSMNKYKGVTGKMILSKYNGKNLNDDTFREVTSFLHGGRNVRRSRKSKNSTHRIKGKRNKKSKSYKKRN